MTPMLKTALLLLMISSLSGCVTSSIATNKSDGLKGPYHKIFIVIHSTERVARFSVPWMDAVRKEFDQRGIALKVYEVSGREDESLSLTSQNTNDEVNSQINEFQPEVVLLIALKKIEAYGGVQIGRPGSNGATFDMRLFTREDNKTPVWRAKFEVFGDYGVSMAVSKGTRTFLDQLEKDNIIAPGN